MPRVHCALSAALVLVGAVLILLSPTGRTANAMTTDEGAAHVRSIGAPAIGTHATIPAFSRKYGVSCALCHAPAPRLNAFGETFAGNGFEFAIGEPPVDTIDTQDATLRLMQAIPLAVRLDIYGQMLTSAEGAQASSDLQTPWFVKVLSGGQIAPRISYYMYFFLSERGEVAGLEDAYVQFSDLAGAGVNLLVGQFQVSDPLFKRELRLEYEDYQAYRVRVGDARADLTYDRGLMLAYSPWEGADASVQVVNGQGLERGSAARQYDRDGGKNVALHLAHAMGPVRLGGFAYFGREDVGGARDNILIWGPEATVAVRPNLELNVQYLRRRDDNPFFLAAPPDDVIVDSGFAELIWAPAGATGRWTFTGLYNRIESDEPVFSLRTGEAGLLDLYESGALGANFLLWRNVRLTGEAAWDFQRDQARFTAGAMTAF